MKITKPALLLFSVAYEASAFSPVAFVPRRAPSKLFSTTTARDSKVTAGFVTIQETSQTLYFVPSIADIDTGNGLTEETVSALQMENDVGVVVKAMPKGANLCEISLDGVNYVWENNGVVRGSGEAPSSGGTYYGPGSNSFPLDRGLILNGGVRFAAVTAEHGLYYDTEWPMEKIETADGEKSIEFTIQDTAAQRALLEDQLSIGQFNRADGYAPEPPNNRMTKYPVTDMTFKFKITLKAGEKLVRLSMTIINNTDKPCNAEAWLPMTFPINKESEILSHQKTRWRRDEWWNGFLPNVINWADITNIQDESGETYDWNKPLDWPLSGIFYDFPEKQGKFHGCTIDIDGKGIVYYAPETSAHYTKMWGWGDPEKFDREWAIINNPMAAGRPKTEYYEPWSSGFNFAFFQTTEFQAQKEYNWEIALVPIPGGLEYAKPLADKLSFVDQYLEGMQSQLDSIKEVNVKDL
ncbi:hypothetical protein ACA910_012081 [Epithemia clementina (nom. ined.)]